jgi:hypothetical protein
MQLVADPEEEYFCQIPNHRWKNNIKMGPKEMGSGAVGWIYFSYIKD